jgi:putative oxygen-independent coproporphyrinogen III oxidase
MAGIYIHIPFCKTRCIYCDFYSTTQSDKKDAYISALCKELAIRNDYLKNQPIHTIYIGGGTPTQLKEAHFDSIFNTIKNNYDIEQCEEITLEANPDDLNDTYLKMLSEQPFNRISIGIQTFDDNKLRLLHRRHNAQQAIDAVKRCRQYGFSNISIDLIYGLPSETIEQWNYDLNQAIALDVEHISAYHLTYGEGTPIDNLRKKHIVKEVPEEDSIAFYKLLTQSLKKAGYLHYEISNFCKPDKYAKHNSSYWRNIEYIGCGPSAHSYNGESRQWNIASLNDYIRLIESNDTFYTIEELSPANHYDEYIITSLRTMWGLSLSHIEQTFGEKYKNYCLTMSKPYIHSGNVLQQGDSLFLSEEGFLISDEIMRDLIWDE